MIKANLIRIVIPRGKFSFVQSLPQGAKLFDIGCGNNSPEKIARLRPDLDYKGIDIGEYNQSENYDQYKENVIMSTPERFAQDIAQFDGEFDAVLSAHNLEHCNDYKAVVSAMIQALKPGGQLYTSFPSEKTANLPSREGTLNFYDDDTHLNLIPYDEYLQSLMDQGMSIDYAIKNHRPTLPAIIGGALEPISRLRKKNMPHGTTWAYYGFETIVVSTKKA